MRRCPGLSVLAGLLLSSAIAGMGTPIDVGIIGVDVDVDVDAVAVAVAISIAFALTVLGATTRRSIWFAAASQTPTPKRAAAPTQSALFRPRTPAFPVDQPAPSSRIR